MGDYLLYDMEDKEFGTDIRGLENYFFSNNGNQIYWPLEERVRRFERQEIQNTLLLYGRDMEGKQKAAKELGISLATLYNKIKE